MTQLIDALFSTKALELAKPDQAFWYTSGSFGPFYINTHYLYGSAAEAEGLLGDIEHGLKSMPSFYDRILTKVRAQLAESTIYKKTIDQAAESIEAAFDLSRIDVISGGERRDFFFSIALADVLAKPHLSIRKDGTTYLHPNKNTAEWGGTLLEDSNSFCIAQANLENKKVLHVADIVNLASSWIDRWLPAVEKCGSRINYGFAILDRCQGGLDTLAEAGVDVCVIERTDKDFFAAALEADMLTEEQAGQAVNFLKNPSFYEREFLRLHPDFLEKEISTKGRNAERALLYLKKHKRLSAQ